MAKRKTIRKVTPQSLSRGSGQRAKAVSKGSQAIVIFWLVFIIVIISVFMLNFQTIQRNFNLFKTRLTASSIEEDIPNLEEEPLITVTVDQPPRTTEPAVTPATPASTAVSASTATPAEPARPDTTATQSATQPTTQPTTQPVTTPATQPVAPQQPAVTGPTQTRTVYFTQVDRDGQIRQSRVTRRLPASTTPLQDAINAMLLGPSPSELGGNLLNFIPQNTRLISATIRGTTAYINFSEDFLFNTFGVEGYVAQLRQIVWTVTEFSNVNDVQILIEGRVHNYLAEGIWIGSPIRRESF